MTAGGTPSASVDPTAVLDRLDSQLGEIARRQHRFAWLRDPGSGEWLVVDAYYPGNRVVVILTEDRRLMSLCGDLVPRNGLFLVALSAAEVTEDASALISQLRTRLEIQGWVPRSDLRRGQPPPAPAAPTGPAPVLAPAPRPTDAPSGPARSDGDDFEVPAGVRIRTPRPTAPPRPGASPAEGIGIGITLVLAVVLELAAGGGLVGLGAGDYVLGFGCVLDACARVLGLVVASQNADLDAAWTSVIFGSPALWGLKDSEQSDLAPVARVTAILAGLMVALGAVLAIV
jgi:hypothetical protein